MLRVKFILLVFFSIALSSEWIDLGSSIPSPPSLSVSSSNIDNSNLTFELKGYSLDSYMINNIEYFSVKFPNGASLLEEGNPNLQKFSSSIIIPDNKNMEVQIISSEYVEIENINIVPSKGNISRLINPEDIEYSFSDIYSQNSFFPREVAILNDPYVLRDYRGQVVQINPMQYNPVTKVLRIYTNIELQVSSNEEPTSRSRDDVDSSSSRVRNLYSQ